MFSMRVRGWRTQRRAWRSSGERAFLATKTSIPPSPAGRNRTQPDEGVCHVLRDKQESAFFPSAAVQFPFGGCRRGPCPRRIHACDRFSTTPWHTCAEIRLGAFVTYYVTNTTEDGGRGRVRGPTHGEAHAVKERRDGCGGAHAPKRIRAYSKIPAGTAPAIRAAPRRRSRRSPPRRADWCAYGGRRTALRLFLHRAARNAARPAH